MKAPIIIQGTILLLLSVSGWCVALFSLGSPLAINFGASTYLSAGLSIIAMGFSPSRRGRPLGSVILWSLGAFFAAIGAFWLMLAIDRL